MVIKGFKVMKCRSCGCEFEPLYRNGLLVSKFCISCLAAKGKAKVKRDWNIEKQQRKEKLKTHSDWLKDLQKEINTIVRLIDKGTFCHSTQKPLNKIFDAGHVFTTKANPEIRFNLFNIYAQSVYANQYLSGDPVNYLATLREVYGEEHLNLVLGLKAKYKDLKITTEEVKEALKIARKIVRDLKGLDRVYSASERLQLRDRYNKQIGIYHE